MKEALIVAAVVALALSGCAAAPASEIAQPVTEVVATNPPAVQAEEATEPAVVAGRVTFISIIRADVPALAQYSDARLLALADLACTERTSGIRLEDIDHIPGDGTAEYPAGELDRNVAAGAVLLICPGAGL
jgi:hypothetical protein